MFTRQFVSGLLVLHAGAWPIVPLKLFCNYLGKIRQLTKMSENVMINMYLNTEKLVTVVIYIAGNRGGRQLTRFKPNLNDFSNLQYLLAVN